MKPSLISATIEARIKGGVRRACLLEGPPGVGKTQVVGQVAKRLGMGFMAVHAPLMQPEDYGMPLPNAQRTAIEFVVPAHKFPMEGTDCPDEGILLLDEVSQANNAEQKILANLIQEREIHGKQLKPGWTIVATGNRMADRAGANRLLSHFRNRLTTYQFEPDLNDWTVWALDAGVKPEVVQFCRFKPNMLHDFDAQREINATPRAWAEGVSPALGTVPDDAEFETFKGDVGEGAAAEFRGFLQIYRRLPSPDAVLLDPKNAEVPKEPAILYAITGAVAHRANRSNADRVIAYLERLPGEFTVMGVRDAIQRDRAITTSPAYTRWCARQDII